MSLKSLRPKLLSSSSSFHFWDYSTRYVITFISNQNKDSIGRTKNFRYFLQRYYILKWFPICHIIDKENSMRLSTIYSIKIFYIFSTLRKIPQIKFAIHMIEFAIYKMQFIWSWVNYMLRDKYIFCIFWKKIWLSNSDVSYNEYFKLVVEFVFHFIVINLELCYDLLQRCKLKVLLYTSL